MLRSVRDLIGYKAIAEDGKAGKIVDLLFEDQEWETRYLVVETKHGPHFNFHYLSEGEHSDPSPSTILIKPHLLNPIGLGEHRKELPLKLNREEVGHAESLAAHPSVEQQFENEFAHYFRHRIYDDRPLVNLGATPATASYRPPISAYDHEKEEIEEHKQRIQEIARQHLHSAKEIFGYKLRSPEEEHGTITDLIVDDENWEIRHLVVRNQEWYHKNEYLVDSSTVEKLDWSKETASTRLSKSEIESGKAYHPHDPVNVTDDQTAYDYRGKLAKKAMVSD